MSTIGVLLKKDLMEQTRSKKVIILAAIFTFLAVVSPISAKLLPELAKSLSGQSGIVITVPEATFINSVEQFVKNTSQLVIFVLIFVVAGAISDEKTRKTLELVLVKPVSRTSFVLSKFAAYFLTISLGFFASALVCYFYTVSIFESFSLVNFIMVAALTLIYVLLVIAATIFMSTIAKSAAVAGVVGLLSSFVFSSILGLFSATADYSPGYILAHYPELILKGWDAKFIPPAALSIALIAVFIVGAVVVFRGQEIER
ncbi:MAG: ABC transporter permease subunit [Actinomycetota bacterium]|nr:ABC transporter permease subunit [Actinomycetota bacterium]